MKEKIYIEFRNRDGMEMFGQHFDYGDRVKPSDVGISINDAEDLAKSDPNIKIIRKKV